MAPDWTSEPNVIYEDRFGRRWVRYSGKTTADRIRALGEAWQEERYGCPVNSTDSIVKREETTDADE